jgi:hypothetical protein
MYASGGADLQEPKGTISAPTLDTSDPVDFRVFEVSDGGVWRKIRCKFFVVEDALIASFYGDFESWSISQCY